MSTSSPTELFLCDSCGATLPVRSEHAGKRCRCGRCGAVMVVPKRQESWQQPEQEASPEPRSGQTPQAMHGQQYGLWGVDEAPTPAEMMAKQPKYFPVYCQNCDTLMHATASQIGSKISCPDCGAKALVVEPPPEAKPKSALVADGEEYQIDGPTVSEKLGTRESSPMFPFAKTQAEASRPIVPSKKQKDAKNYYVRRHVECPRVPLLQGVGPMLWRAPVSVWGLGLAASLMLITVLLSGMLLQMGPPFIAMAIPLLVLIPLWLAAASSLWVAILTESSEGNDRLENSPGTDFVEWFSSIPYVLMAVVVAAVPGTVVGRLLGMLLEKQLELSVLAAGTSWIFCFPVVLLSMLEGGSPMAVISPRLVTSLWRRPLHWLLFYLETGLLLIGSMASLVWLVSRSAWFLWLVVPVAIVVSLVYFRLLGRLGWWLAESLSTCEDDLQ